MNKTEEFDEIVSSEVITVDNEVRLNKAIMHVLDTNAGVPVLSEMFLNMSEGVGDYVQKHIEKSLKDSEIKRTRFREESPFLEFVEEYKKSESLINVSGKIAQNVFDFMLENVDIPSADLVFVDFDLGYEKYLAILKFNYKQGYIHFLNTDKGMYNDILIQPCVLPTERQRLDEFVLINLATRDVMLKEKQYLINDHKEFYWSNHILFCEDSISEKNAFEIVEKVAKKVIGTEYSGSYDKLNKVKEALVKQYEDDQEFDIDEIAESVFDQDELVKEKFKSAILMNGLYQDKVAVSSNIESKIYKKQKYITDTGIEISIPVDQLRQKDIIDFKNNPDGTISVVIKNIALLNQK